MKDGWLIVPNWERWQSRADRHDPWIKSYIDQLDRDEYVNLTLAERGILADIRHLYSRHNGQLRAKMLPGLVHARVRIDQLERLKDAGYIAIVAAKPPPLGSETAARAREEKEIEKEKDFPKGFHGKNGNGPERRARAWIANGLAAEVPDAHLEEVIADEFGIAEPELIAELAKLAREQAI